MKSTQHTYEQILLYSSGQLSQMTREGWRLRELKTPQRELKEFKVLEAHLSRLPERMAELKRLKAEVEDLKQKLP